MLEGGKQTEGWRWEVVEVAAGGGGVVVVVVVAFFPVDL